MRRTMFGRTDKDTGKDKNRENARKLDITKVGLMHFNGVNNNYQQTSRI